MNEPNTQETKLEKLSVNIRKKDGVLRVLVTGDEGVTISVEQSENRSIEAFLGASFMVLAAVFDEQVARQIVETFAAQMNRSAGARTEGGAA